MIARGVTIAPQARAPSSAMQVGNSGMFMFRLMSVVLTFSIQPVSISSGQEVPSSPYLSYVYKYADTMLANGRDDYGPQASGLFLSALDRMKLVPLSVRPAPPSGIRREDRRSEERRVG